MRQSRVQNSSKLLKAADRMAKWIDRLEDQDANGGNKWYVMNHAVNARIAYEIERAAQNKRA